MTDYHTQQVRRFVRAHERWMKHVEDFRAGRTPDLLTRSYRPVSKDFKSRAYSSGSAIARARGMDEMPGTVADLRALVF